MPTGSPVSTSRRSSLRPAKAGPRSTRLERYGKPAAVLISPERYAELLDALEESHDVTAFDAAMAEPGDNVPWAQVKADLGWA